MNALHAIHTLLKICMISLRQLTTLPLLQMDLFDNQVEKCGCMHMHNTNCCSSATQMWVLATNLPLIIGDLVPIGDELWECFLLHIDILQLCTARKVTSAQAGYLEALINDHHQMFTRCYSCRVTPKIHYMVHFPKQMIW